MTSVLRRVVAPFAAVTALVATLSACGTGPNQVNSAAIIGDRVISVDQVQSLVDKVVKEPAARGLAQQHKLDLVAREALGQLIVHEALGNVARREGLKVDQDQLAALRAQNPFGQKLSAGGDTPTEQLVPQLVYRARGFEDYANDQLLLLELAKKHLGRDSATYNLVTVQTADEARTLAEQITADPKQSAALMRAAGRKAKAEPTLGTDTKQTTDGVYLSGPENSVFVLPPSQGQQGGGGYSVVHVLSRKTSATTSPDLDLSQAQPSEILNFGLFAARPTIMASNPKISPRYGVWNNLQLKVVPKSEAEVSGFVLAPGSNKS